MYDSNLESYIEPIHALTGLEMGGLCCAFTFE